LNALELELLDGSPAGLSAMKICTFLAINSETDHLPVDAERKNWSIEALQRKTKK